MTEGSPKGEETPVEPELESVLTINVRDLHADLRGLSHALYAFIGTTMVSVAVLILVLVGGH